MVEKEKGSMNERMENSRAQGERGTGVGVKVSLGSFERDIRSAEIRFWDLRFEIDDGDRMLDLLLGLCLIVGEWGWSVLD